MKPICICHHKGIMNKSILVVLLATTALALTPAEKASLQTQVDQYRAAGTNDSHAILRALRATPLIGTSTNVVTVNRDALELKMRQFLKAKAADVGITANDTIGQADSKWDTYAKAQVTAASTTGAKLEAAYQGAADKAMWFSFYTQVRLSVPNDDATVTTTNVVPVLAAPVIAFAIVTGDVEDCFPKPPPSEE